MVIERFREFSAIPHCSFDALAMRDYLVETCKRLGAHVSVDAANNVHAFKGAPVLCLQSHYDMVCMGDAPKIELFEEDGYLKAKNSSLGADNGIGVCMMLEALARFDDIECVFTSDEEVGLIGANNLEVDLKSKYLLNLDNEVESEVIVSCAGGVDFSASKKLKRVEKRGDIYEIEAVGLKGGHSGIDIAKNSRSSIKELSRFIALNGGDVIEFKAGERSNSIPRYGKAKVLFPKDSKLKESAHVRVRFLESSSAQVIDESFLSALNSFSQGVRTYDEELRMPRTSINLSIAEISSNSAKLILFGRSNSKDELRELEFETLLFFRSFGFEAVSNGYYEPWEREEGELDALVLRILNGEIPDSKISSIHAGLECGAIKTRYPNILACAIGPNIYNPHSTNERVEIASVQRVTRALFKIIEELNSKKGL